MTHETELTENLTELVVDLVQRVSATDFNDGCKLTEDQAYVVATKVVPNILQMVRQYESASGDTNGKQ